MVDGCVVAVISNGIPEIGNEVRQTPDVILNSLGLAFHQVISLDSVYCTILRLMSMITYREYTRFSLVG